MERRHFLKLAFGAAAGAATFAAVANAAPLPPVVSAPLAAARTQTAEPAVVSQDDVDHLKPEQVRWAITGTGDGIGTGVTGAGIGVGGGTTGIAIGTVAIGEVGSACVVGNEIFDYQPATLFA